jgi:hypothetical protein
MVWRDFDVHAWTSREPSRRILSLRQATVAVVSVAGAMGVLALAVAPWVSLLSAGFVLGWSQLAGP